MILIKNGYIKTMAGPDIEDGQVLIGDDGKIAAVGKTVEAPADAKIIDAEGRLVTPGVVEAHCHVGLDNEGMGWEGRDYNESTNPTTPEMRAIDSINPQDEAFGNAIRGGVTTVCTGPGSANTVGGTFVAIKCVGNTVDKMILKNPLAMKCAFGENTKGTYGRGKDRSPKTRMGNAAVLRELLFKAQRYAKDMEKEEDKRPSFDMKLEAMIPVMRGEIPLKAHAHRADDIMTAIRIAKEFGVKLTLDHCTDGSLIADELAEEGYPCFVGPSFGNKSKVELIHQSFQTVIDLVNKGLSVSIITDAPVTPIESLPMCAGLAVKQGLPDEEAWKCITINPAMGTGIADRVGSLEPGKDADVVIWTADPIHELSAKSYTTIVDGKIVYSEK